MAIWEDYNLLNKELKKAEKRVEANAVFWKPILHGILTYTEANKCSVDDLLEANVIAEIKLKNK